MPDEQADDGDGSDHRAGTRPPGLDLGGADENDRDRGQAGGAFGARAGQPGGPGPVDHRLGHPDAELPDPAVLAAFLTGRLQHPDVGQPFGDIAGELDPTSAGGPARRDQPGLVRQVATDPAARIPATARPIAGSMTSGAVTARATAMPATMSRPGPGSPSCAGRSCHRRTAACCPVALAELVGRHLVRWSNRSPRTSVT